MGLQIWLRDRLVDEKDATVSVFDHGLLYGDGVFEGIRVYSGRIFECQAHLKRLYESAKAIRLAVPMAADQMNDAMLKTVAANNISDGYIRLIVTRGVGDLGIDPDKCGEPTVIIIASSIRLYSEEFYEKGMTVASVATVRNHPLSCPPQVKSMNYLNNIMAKIEANLAGAGEAIMYNHLGYVAEASGDNVFIVKNGVLIAPPVEAGSLDGITRQVVMKLACENGIQTVEKNLTRFDLYAADEMFLTGTAAEVIGVVEMDGRTIGNGTPGPVTRRLRQLFFEYARS